MKIFYASVIILTCIIFYANAQTIPNSGFENWILQAGGYEDPNGWATNNDTTFHSISVTKTTDSYSGNFALQVINNWRVFNGPWPGFASVLYRDTNIVNKISAYVKCDSISGTGKGLIDVRGYLGTSDQIIGSWETSTEIPQYTLIEIPLTPINNYDSILIRIIGFAENLSNGMSTGFAMLKVDNMTEEIVSDIVESDFSKSFKISPNPFKEYCILSFENPNGENYTLSIYNSQGGLVRSISDIQAREVNIQRMNLSSGNYSYKIQSANSLGIGKFIIE